MNLAGRNRCRTQNLSLSLLRGILCSMQALLANRHKMLYRIEIGSSADIECKVGSPHIAALSSSDRRYHFWFTPLAGSDLLNSAATRLLYAVTRFEVCEVPLLRGSVVITSADAQGHVQGLDEDDLAAMRRCVASIQWRDDWRLERRIRRVAWQDRIRGGSGPGAIAPPRVSHFQNRAKGRRFR